MYHTLTALAFRSAFSDCLTRVMLSGDRFLIVRHGTDTAAVVPVPDLLALEHVSENRAAFLDAQHEARMREWRALKEGLG